MSTNRELPLERQIGVAGATWLTLTTRVTGPVNPSARNTASTAPTPSVAQYERRPSSPPTAPAALADLGEQARRRLLRSTARVSTTLSGPRLLAAVGSYPSPGSFEEDPGR